MTFSKKRQKVEEPEESKVLDKVAKRIAGILLSVQMKFASVLSRRINSLTSRSQQVCLTFFCLTSVGFSLYAFSGAFRDSRDWAGKIKPDVVAVPKYFDQPNFDFRNSVNENDILRINRFKKCMDSLRHCAKGRLKYDSILKVRPGLMDSIKVIEEIYYSQSK